MLGLDQDPTMVLDRTAKRVRAALLLVRSKAMCGRSITAFLPHASAPQRCTLSPAQLRRNFGDLMAAAVEQWPSETPGHGIMGPQSPDHAASAVDAVCRVYSELHAVRQCLVRVREARRRAAAVWKAVREHIQVWLPC